MDESENKFDERIEPMGGEWERELDSLRMQLSVALAVLVLFSCLVTAYFFKQFRMARAEAANTKLIYQQNLDSFPTAQANDFLNKLSDYSKTHPDFQPIMDKYPPYFSQAASGVKKK